MKIEEFEKRISLNGYEIICRNICGANLAIAPEEKVYIYTIIPQIPANDNQVIQEGIANHNVFRKLLNFIFEDTLEDIIINIESVFICTYDIPENTKQQLDENNIRYLSPYMNDNCFNSIFPKIENLDSCYNEYKSYIETVVKYIISSVSNGDYNGFLEWLIARSSKPSEQPQEHLQPIKIMGEPFELDVDISKLKNNFIDHGDYIEFKEPINGILMVQKKYSNSCKLEEAEILANEMNLGGYNDWLIPTIQELQTLYHIRDYLDMKKGGTLWSSSTLNKKVDTVFQVFTSKYHIVADYINEEIKSVIYKHSEYDYRNVHTWDEEPELVYENTFDNDDLKCNTRCIRIVNERLKNRENEMEIDSYGGGKDCIIQPIGYTIY